MFVATRRAVSRAETTAVATADRRRQPSETRPAIAHE